MSAYLVYPPNNYYQTQAYPSSYGNQYYENSRGSPQWMMNQYGGVVPDHHNSQPSSHYAQLSSAAISSSSDYNSFISIDYYNEEDLERDNTSQHSSRTSSNYVATTTQQQQALLSRQRHNRQPSHDSSVMSTPSVASSVRSSRPTTQIQQQAQFVNNNTRASPVASSNNQNYNNNYNNNYQYSTSNNTAYSNNYNTTPNNNINYSKSHNFQQQIPPQTNYVPPQQQIPPLSFANTTNHITHQTYSSLETDSSVDICTVKDDHIWMIDNLVTIEEAEQLIDIYQDVSRRTQEALIQQQILQQQRRSAMSVKSMRRGTYSTYGDESIISSSPHYHTDRVQHIEYSNEEFANFIFEQLRDVLPPDQSKLYGEKVGKTFELSGIYEKFTVYELRPGEKIEKSKGEDKCRIIEVESENLNKITNEQYHEKSFLTCLICLKGVVDYNEPKQPLTNEQKLFGVNFYDMSKERPEHFIVLDHVGKSCLFSNNAQLFEVVENHGTENVYLLAVNVMYKSIITNSPLRTQSLTSNQTEDRERSLSLSSNGSVTMDDNENINQYREILQQQQKKSNGGGKYLMWAFGTSFLVITSFFLQTGIKVNKPIISKLLSIISKQLNI